MCVTCYKLLARSQVAYTNLKKGYRYDIVTGEIIVGMKHITSDAFWAHMPIRILNTAFQGAGEITRRKWICYEYRHKRI